VKFLQWRPGKEQKHKHHLKPVAGAREATARLAFPWFNRRFPPLTTVTASFTNRAALFLLIPVRWLNAVK
jgi:hypothetical protein